jgi:mRNA interferase RelE/StbE
MKSTFRKSFTRDLRKIKDRALLDRIKEAIDKTQSASDAKEISNLKKLSGGGNYFRIRVGDYRIGVILEQGTVDFVRCLHRRDLYRFFP